MPRILGGAVLVIAGIAAFIEAHSHRPFVPREGFAREGVNDHRVEALVLRGEASHLSQTAYDLLRTGAWCV